MKSGEEIDADKEFKQTIIIVNNRVFPASELKNILILACNNEAAMQYLVVIILLLTSSPQHLISLTRIKTGLSL